MYNLVNLFLQVNDTLNFFVTLEDEVGSSENGVMNNIVPVPISVIVADENDNPPLFKNVS